MRTNGEKFKTPENKKGDEDMIDTGEEMAN